VSEFLRDLDRRVLPVLGDAVPWMLRGARGRRFLTVAGSTLAVLLAIGLVYAVNRPAATPAYGAVVNIGVADGDSVPQYVADRAAALRQIAAGASVGASPHPMFALVSLAVYQTPKQLVTTLGGLHVTQVYMRARPGGKDAPVVPAPAYHIPFDIESAMLDQANQDRGKAADLRILAGQVTGSNAEEIQLRANYQEREALTEANERAWRSLCACVFAAVVYGTEADLVTASGRKAVRVVDALPSLRSLDRAIFRPPLPEEISTAGPWPADTWPADSQ
jgi:hypothetical protein